MIGELDAGDNLLKTFIYASKSHVPDYLVDNNNVKFKIITDQLGSVRLVVKARTGEIVQKMPFGFAGGIYDDRLQICTNERVYMIKRCIVCKSTIVNLVIFKNTFECQNCHSVLAYKVKSIKLHKLFLLFIAVGSFSAVFSFRREFYLLAAMFLTFTIILLYFVDKKSEIMLIKKNESKNVT